MEIEQRSLSVVLPFAPALRVLASGAETAGRFGLVELTLAPYSAGPSLHSHAEHLEGCLLLEGLVALTCDETTVTISQGGFRAIQPGERHYCWNPTSAPARLLLIYAPGGDEDMLQRLAAGYERT